MILDSEETSFEREKSTEEKLIASLLVLDPSVETTPVDLIGQSTTQIKNERWRDSICTAVRRNGNTEVSTNPAVWISPFDLLSDREKEQIRLSQIVRSEYADRKAPETFKKLMKRARRFSMESNETRSTQSPRRFVKESHPMVSEESQTNEGNFADSNQQQTIISKEFASQTSEGGLAILIQSEPTVSKESSSQTTDASLDISRQTEPVISKESASQTIAGSSDTSKTSGMSPVVSNPTELTKDISSDDHVFALPTVPPQRSSSRVTKTGKNSKNDDLSEKSKTSEAGIHSRGRKTSKDTPDPRRRSSRLSSKSCSEKDEDSESNDEKTSVKSASKYKRGKKLESSGGESDEGRSTPATRSSRRLKK